MSVSDDSEQPTQPAPTGKARTQFQPKQSGNPGGRPKGARRIAAEAADAREYKADDGETYRGAAAMMHVLLDLATNRTAKDRDRREAANSVIDRLWGKAPQRLEVDDRPATTIDFDSMTDEQIDAEIARLEREEAEQRRLAETAEPDVPASED